jgi:hypothetical protein
MARAYPFASQVSFPTMIVLDIVFILFKEIVYKNYSFFPKGRSMANITLSWQSHQPMKELDFFEEICLNSLYAARAVKVAAVVDSDGRMVTGSNW